MRSTNSTLVLGLALALAATASCSNESDDNQALRKATKVVPVERNPLKSQSTSCPEEKLYSLRLRRNQKLLWQKTHEELLQMEGSEVETSRRLKSDNERVLPVTSLLPSGTTDIQSIVFTDCGGKDIKFSLTEILETEKPYYLAQNRKGWLKLSTRDEEDRYLTAMKAVTDITLSTRD